MIDEGRQRAVVIHKTGFPDAVVWNPWIDKAAGMADFGDDEYKVGIFVWHTTWRCVSSCVHCSICHSAGKQLRQVCMLLTIPCPLRHQGMLCLEPAVAGSGPVTLEAGKVWTAQQRLSLRKL